MSNFYIFLSVIIPAIMSFAAVSWIYSKILGIAKSKNVMDNPDARKYQKTPIPVMGGLAVFFGLVAGLLMGVVMHAMPYILSHEVIATPTARLFPVLCAIVLMLYVGAMDDMSDLSPISRLFIEVMVVLGVILASGGCIDTFRGMWGIERLSWWIAVPLTVFAGVGIINAINMVDGVNGLSSGICIACSLLFGVTFLKVEDPMNAVLAFCMAASLMPFFFHNVFGTKSRMFIGDAGTMMMGIMIIWFVISTLRSDSPVPYYGPGITVNMIAVCLSIVAVPIFDTLRVMTTRIFRGQSPFHADKTHLHHIFVEVGLSHIMTTVIEVMINVLVLLSWFIAGKCDASMDVQLYVVIVVSVLLVWMPYFVLDYHYRHQTKSFQRLKSLNSKTEFSDRKWWIKMSEWLDR